MKSTLLRNSSPQAAGVLVVALAIHPETEITTEKRLLVYLSACNAIGQLLGRMTRSM